MSAVQKIREFIASDCPQSLVSLGYEIETQFEGEKEFDSDAFYESFEIDDDFIISYLGLPYDRTWIRTINNNNPNGLLGAFELDRDTLLQEAYDREVENEDSDYWIGNSKEHIEIDGFQTESDGSVSGWEFSPLGTLPNGGVTYRDALVLASTFFDELPSEYHIDSDCSCHVHLQVLGVERHVGSYRLYMLIVDELSKIWSSPDCPATLKSRIQRCNSYYSPQDNHDSKYNTVRVHPQYGTWEFRLWGNTRNDSEVKFAIDSSISAFKNAYSRYFSRDTSLVDSLAPIIANNNAFSVYSRPINQAFKMVARRAMVSGSTIASAIESYLKEFQK